MATWESVLDDLERQVEHAERLVASSEAPTEAPTEAQTEAQASADALTSWEAPADLDPLPHRLAARAQRLLDRQHAAIDGIHPLLVATRQQLQVGERFGRTTTRPATPVYVDVTA